MSPKNELITCPANICEQGLWSRGMIEHATRQTYIEMFTGRTEVGFKITVKKLRTGEVKDFFNYKALEETAVIGFDCYNFPGAKALHHTGMCRLQRT